MLIPIILLTFLTQSNCHNPVNGSDIIILGGHADLVRGNYFMTTRRPVYYSSAMTFPPIVTAMAEKMTTISSDNEEFIENSGKDDVVFIPAERWPKRNDDRGYYHEPDYSNNKKLKDSVKEVDSPSGKGDVLFVPGKYNDVQEPKKPSWKERADEEEREDEHEEIPSRRSGKSIKRQRKIVEATTELDCSWRDCGLEVNSICGGKREMTSWRYRLFRNECFFNKVNCQFSWKKNRYIKLDLDLCKNVGSHYAIKHDNNRKYRPLELYLETITTEKPPQVLRRVMSGRRAITLSLQGLNCEHQCPLSCPEDYAPECAASTAGEKRVFRNHCTLDAHSCKTSTAWRIKPLSDCIGTRKADMQQNRAFIDWMQRTGILDSKGRMVAM